jgi:hypothetical protein
MLGVGIEVEEGLERDLLEDVDKGCFQRFRL